MIEEVVVIVWVEERLYSIWTLEYSNGNVLCGIRKKLWTTAFCTRKSILISEAAIRAIQAKVSTILEEVVVIVSVEERLDSMTTTSSNIVETFAWIALIAASEMRIDFLVQKAVVHNFLRIPQSTFPLLYSRVQME